MIKKNKHVIPGFRVSIGITITMLTLIVLIPLASVFLQAAGIGLSEYIRIITAKEVQSAYFVSIICSLIAALINCIFGLLLAYLLVRYDFIGKNILDGMIELPFALPTAVAGIALTALYSDQGWIGGFFANFGIKIAYTRIGITLAMIFIGIPFVVRSIQPVLEKLDDQYEEAAMMLGANKITTFFKVILPELFPSMLAGFGLAFARGIGEYGSVVFIAGNIPNETQIAPLLIMAKLEQYDYTQATAIALTLLVFSFLLLLINNGIQLYFHKITK